MDVADSCDWFGECFVASTPIVHDLWTFDVQAARDLGGIHEIVQVHLSSHVDDRTPGVSHSEVSPMRTS
jgi:hypothetical protein